MSYFTPNDFSNLVTYNANDYLAIDLGEIDAKEAIANLKLDIHDLQSELANYAEVNADYEGRLNRCQGHADDAANALYDFIDRLNEAIQDGQKLSHDDLVAMSEDASLWISKIWYENSDA